jgi:dihydroflavonol-4-reductase
MRVLLTGATGFLGNNLLRLLLSQGHSVCVAHRYRELPESLQDLEFESVPGDLTTPGFTSPWPRCVDAIIHSAAQIQIGRTRLAESRQVNVEATREIADYALAHGIRLVHVSTVDTLGHSVDGRPITEGQREPAKPPATYVTTKREAEAVVKGAIGQGLDAVVVHPGFMLGPWDWRPSSAEMMLAVAKVKPPFAPGGGASVCDVRDVAAGIVSAMQRGGHGEHFILAGENVSYLDLWQRMARVIGCRAPRVALPNWIAGISGWAGDLGTRITGRESNVNSMATRMGQLRHYYASSKAERELGYAMRPVDEAIEACWQWIRERGWVR